MPRFRSLPLLFVCEDNGFAAFTRGAAVTAGGGPAVRAEACGVPATARKPPNGSAAIR